MLNVVAIIVLTDRVVSGQLWVDAQDVMTGDTRWNRGRWGRRWGLVLGTTNPKRLRVFLCDHIFTHVLFVYGQGVVKRKWRNGLGLEGRVMNVDEKRDIKGDSSEGTPARGRIMSRQKKKLDFGSCIHSASVWLRLAALIFFLGVLVDIDWYCAKKNQKYSKAWQESIHLLSLKYYLEHILFACVYYVFTTGYCFCFAFWFSFCFAFCFAFAFSFAGPCCATLALLSGAYSSLAASCKSITHKENFKGTDKKFEGMVGQNKIGCLSLSRNSSE